MSDLDSIQLELGEAHLASPLLPSFTRVPHSSAATPGIDAPTWSQPATPSFSKPTGVANSVTQVHPNEANLASSVWPTNGSLLSASAPTPGVAGLTGWDHPATPTFSEWDLRALGQSLAQAANALFAPSAPQAAPAPHSFAPAAVDPPVGVAPSNAVNPSSAVAPTALAPHTNPRANVTLNPFAVPLLFEQLETPQPSSLERSSHPLPAGGPFAGSPWAAPGSSEVPELGTRVRNGVFDPHAVRAQFPILQQRVNGHRLIWLDNAATTQKPQVVIDRLKAFYENENSNIHRAAHTLAARATDAYESARKSVQRFINAPSVDTVVFTRGATEAINLVAHSFGRKYIDEGDEIVISCLEHHANIVPWQQLALKHKVRLRVAPVDDKGDIVLSEFQRILNGRTRLVAFTQVSNALGTITPAQEMIQMAHRHGARVLLDGAQSISHMPVDVQALDCDFYVFSGHKVFAPTGIGALYGKSDILESLPPWQGGGNMIQDVTFERVLFQKPPARFEAGTGNIADAVGLGAALDWLTGVGIHNVERHEHELLVYGLSQLATVPGLRMIGNPSQRAGVLSFILEGQETERVGSLLDKEGIAVRSGHHCAQPILRRLGVEASVRASLAPYNTHEDIDALVDALHRLQLQRQPAHTQQTHTQAHGPWAEHGSGRSAV